MSKDHKMQNYKQTILVVFLLANLFVISSLPFIPEAKAVSPQILYGCKSNTNSGNSSLYTINTSTGAATLVGAMTIGAGADNIKGCSGLVFNSQSQLLTIANNNSFYQSVFLVNVSTGATTFVAQLLNNDTGGRTPDITIQPSTGFMYASGKLLCSGDTTQFYLCKINPQNWGVNTVGNISTVNNFAGHAIDFHSNGSLFFARTNTDGEHDANKNISLYQINPSNGILSYRSNFDSNVTNMCVGELGDGVIIALDFDVNNVLYGILKCGAFGGITHLVILNLNNSTLTHVGLIEAASNNFIDGIAFTPVVSPLPPAKITHKSQCGASGTNLIGLGIAVFVIFVIIYVIYVGKITDWRQILMMALAVLILAAGISGGGICT